MTDTERLNWLETAELRYGRTFAGNWEMRDIYGTLVGKPEMPSLRAAIDSAVEARNG